MSWRGDIVNHSKYTIPAQTIKFSLLNGSDLKSYNFIFPDLKGHMTIKVQQGNGCAFTKLGLITDTTSYNGLYMWEDNNSLKINNLPTFNIEDNLNISNLEYLQVSPAIA
jgi:hypothetical protein